MFVRFDVFVSRLVVLDVPNVVVVLNDVVVDFDVPRLVLKYVVQLVVVLLLVGRDVVREVEMFCMRYIR